MIQANLFQEELKKTSSSKLKAGVHTNVKLVGIEVEEDYFDVIFEKEGLTANKRLWTPKGSFPNPGESKQDALEREERRNITYVVFLMNLVLGTEATSSVKAPTYDEFMKRAAALVNNKASQKSYNVKVVNDSKGYSTLPAYPAYAEIYTEGQPPNLKFSVKELASMGEPVDVTKPSASDLPF